MANYLPSEIVDMILILGKCHVNYAAASRLYAERFPDRRHPTNLTISTLTERARNGILVRERRNHVYNENNVQAVTVLAAVHVEPQISTREIEREIGIPESTVSRILRFLKYHAYHITITQSLRLHHILARINFCQWALQIVQNDPSFFRYVLFSDESKFYSDGHVNRHNRWMIKIDGMLWCGAE